VVEARRFAPRKLKINHVFAGPEFYAELGSPLRMERTVVFRCPITGSSVEILLTPPDRSGEAGNRYYKSLSCPSCTRLHYINVKTGKLLGYERE
jgi:hypothetical protein